MNSIHDIFVCLCDIKRHRVRHIDGCECSWIAWCRSAKFGRILLVLPGENLCVKQMA